jgi:hypothetical protein
LQLGPLNYSDNGAFPAPANFVASPAQLPGEFGPVCHLSTSGGSLLGRAYYSCSQFVTFSAVKAWMLSPGGQYNITIALKMQVVYLCIFYLIKIY